MKCDSCKKRTIFAGASLTQWSCKICGKEYWAGNNNPPSICKKCSYKYKKCERCESKI